MKINAASAEVLMIVFMLAPLVYLAFIWTQLPAEIATHYNIEGNPDGWMRKENAALIVGGMSLLLYFVLRFLPKIDPKGQLQTANFLKLRLVITFFFSAMMGAMFYVAAHQVDTPGQMGVMMALASLLVARIGNYMTTVKPNWFVGIRTPWTLDNEVVWRKTHRLGGRLMVAGGLLAAVMALVLPTPYNLEAVAAIILLSALIPVVYSYIYFQQQKDSLQ